MGYERLLVTLDGSKFSERALKQVVRIAEPGAYIHLLSVQAETIANEVDAMAKAAQPGVAAPWPPIAPIADPQRADARDSYLHEVKSWLSQADFHVTTESRTGEVISAILSVAQSGYEVIVMVTHGRTGINKAVLGSVTEAVLRDAPCPVLAIPIAVN